MSFVNMFLLKHDRMVSPLFLAVIPILDLGGFAILMLQKVLKHSPAQ